MTTIDILGTNPARERTSPRRRALGALLILAAVAWAGGSAEAQTFTMGKKCRAQVEAANQMNDAGQYAEALAAFDAIVKTCDTKDGKELVQEGRARALNGLGRHTEAITAAEAAQAAFPHRDSLNAYFERAYAEERMGDTAAAALDYQRIIELTEKNQNVTERATIYAKLADMNEKAGKTAEAQEYLAKAIELDPGNPDYDVLEGDWAVRAGDYDAAFAAYDRAVANGHAGAGMYQIRAEARLKQVEEAYGTTNVQELRAKMTPTETAQVCAEVTRALELGLKDMKLDMFSALVCR